MAETPPRPNPASEPSAPLSSGAEQARFRKERREAKIKAGGSARLNKITGLGGGVQRGMQCLFSPSCCQRLLKANPHGRFSTSTHINPTHH